MPIGTYTGYFSSTFDGNNKIIKNLYINKPIKDYQGLFGNTQQSTIKNLGIKNINIIGQNYIGGLIGQDSESIITNCYTTRNINSSGNSVGGLIGYNAYASITNCYSTGNITGNSNIGGLIGNDYNQPATTNSFWDIEASEIILSDGGTGLTTTQMKNPQTFINAKWDINIWILKDGKYPTLFYQKVYKYLIEQNNNFYTIKDNSLLLLDTISQDNFINYGFDDINELNYITQLNNFKIYMYKE